MKLCQLHGNGVCYRCERKPPKNCGDICRYEAELWLDAFKELLKTELTDEQKEIMEDFFDFEY